jgi:hypothetical protein
MTCPTGCCDSFGVCQQGLTGAMCGNFGTNCQSCLSMSQVCSNQACVPGPDAGIVCGPSNCNGCCDALGNCWGGYEAALCGSGGTGCVNCAALGDQCEFGSCLTPDGGTLCSQSCAGCCDESGACQPGFADTQCGEIGSTCTNCRALTPASTCDFNVTPRACTSQQTVCPAPYPTCPAGLEQAAPARQKVCSTSELQSAATACSGGPYSSPCVAFSDFENNTNESCSSCLRGFEFDFVEQVGVRYCLAPFLDAACNHNGACIADCVTQSCFSCSDRTTTDQCETLAQSTTCASFFQADPCASTALAGAGAVCNPATYQGNFGAWLQAVGARYCGP